MPRFCLITLFFIQQLFSQNIQILANHLGYETMGPKKAILQAQSQDTIYSFTIHNYTNDLKVESGKPLKIGTVDQWKNWEFWAIDFSSLDQEGNYYITIETNRGIVRSFPFLIQNTILERHTVSDVIFYFRGQRCTGLMDQADHKMTFSSGLKDTVDVHGGWYDASGDYGKHLSHLSFSTYFNPQQIPIVVYSLGKSYDLLAKRHDDNFKQILRRLLDEIIYGADYLVRIYHPGGSFYETISGRGPEKMPQDRRISPTMRNFAITEKPSGTAIKPPDIVQDINTQYEVGYRSGGGVAIAALAMAAAMQTPGDFPPDRYLQTAEAAFHFLEKNNTTLTNDGKENIVDDYCALAAATELYRSSGKKEYKQAADRRVLNLMQRLTSWNKYTDYWRADNQDRPYFHAVEAGFPLVALLSYLEICDAEQTSAVLLTVKKSLQSELAITDEVPNPFGYARQLVQHQNGKRNSCFFFPHDTETAPWWQGENARLASLACAARLAAPYFKTETSFYDNLQRYAQDQINWILGLNPFDVCMLAGTGRNNPEYMFFGSYQYTSAPGGICNGITAGLENEHDIDFNLPYSITGKDYDWRWVEQWLPHAAWYLLAVSAPHDIH